MDTTVFNIQLLISVVVYGLLGKWFALPWLDRMPRDQAILISLIPQLFRQLGMYALVAATYLHFSDVWATATAYGDLATQITSLLAVVLLRRKSGLAIAVTWISIVIGLVDTAVSTYLSASTHIPLYQLYSAWFLSVFFLATLLWSDIYAIRYLLRKPA